MFNGNAVPSVADIAAVTNRNNGDGMGYGWDWIWIVLFVLFGGWGNGWNGNGNNQAGFTDAAVQRGFDQQAVISKLDGINNGLCDGFYATNNTIQQGNFGLQTALLQGFNALQAQMSDCCCENREAIAQVRFDMANNTCAITNGMAQGFAQLDRTINDKFCDLEMKQMQQTINEQASLIQSLNLAQSQANQTRQIIDTVRPCPVPAYQTCNPWATNGTSYAGCCNSYNGGCGC